MASLNIKKGSDAFYRYKMPSLQAKIEGKGNGIKTVVPNMSEIARALNRPPSYPTKFFGCELGAQVICDDKANRYIVSGAHDTSRLQELLYLFITKYVLCPECQNPETNLFVSSLDDLIYVVCKACGGKKEVDNRHRLATFIQKSAPTLKASVEPVSISKKKTLKKSESNASVNDKDPYEDFGVFVEQNRGASLTEIFEKIADLGIKTHYALAVYIQVIFDNEDTFMQTLSSKTSILKEFCSGGEKYQKCLIGGIERLLVLLYPNLIKKLPVIFQKLYQEDILEEEVIISWATEEPSKKYVSDSEQLILLRKSAAPFVDWLKTADQETDEE